MVQPARDRLNLVARAFSVGVPVKGRSRSLLNVSIAHLLSRSGPGIAALNACFTHWLIDASRFCRSSTRSSSHLHLSTNLCSSLTAALTLSIFVSMLTARRTVLKCQCVFGSLTAARLAKLTTFELKCHNGSVSRTLSVSLTTASSSRRRSWASRCAFVEANTRATTLLYMCSGSPDLP
jgi:hypothetical protein